MSPLSMWIFGIMVSPTEVLLVTVTWGNRIQLCGMLKGRRPDESCVFLERLRRESWCNIKTPREFGNIKDVGVADSMDHESYVSLRQ